MFGFVVGDHQRQQIEPGRIDTSRFRFDFEVTLDIAERRVIVGLRMERMNIHNTITSHFFIRGRLQTPQMYYPQMTQIYID